MRRTLLKTAAGLTLLAAAGTMPAFAAKPVDLTFYYPVAVGGPVTHTIDAMVADFEKENPDIRIKAVYAGTYQESLVKALTAYKSGTPPQLAVLLSTDLFTLIDEDAIAPIDKLASSADDKKWLSGFYKGFMDNSQTGGKTWGIPFQRSTIVMYWNKPLFKAAGLDPDKAPATWDEMADYARKLTKRDASGNVSQWGIKIPSTGFPYWMFQALATENDTPLMNSAGTKTYFDKPGAVEALQYWVDLSAKDKAAPSGVVEWGTTPKDFLEQKAAIIWTTTGNLTNIRTHASFPFGVAMLPSHKRRGSPTGGGNFYIFKSASPEQQKAAVKFIQWMTAPERAAEWSIKTGYVAVSPAAYKTKAMEDYAKGFPAATVARDQLEYAVPELSVHENGRIYKFVGDAVQAAVTGSASAKDALASAQQQADRVLRAYK